jgi:hypothetical protein
VRRFRYLDETIAVILAFVGAKILADDVVHLGDVASLAVIVGLLGCGVAASVLRTASPRRTPAEEARRRPPRLSRAAHAAPAQARGGTCGSALSGASACGPAEACPTVVSHWSGPGG